MIQLFESGRLAAPEAALSEYVTALARTNRLDNTQLLQTLQVRSVCVVQLLQTLQVRGVVV